MLHSAFIRYSYLSHCNVECFWFSSTTMGLNKEFNPNSKPRFICSTSSILVHIIIDICFAIVTCCSSVCDQSWQLLKAASSLYAYLSFFFFQIKTANYCILNFLFRFETNSASLSKLIKKILIFYRRFTTLMFTYINFGNEFENKIF